MRVSFVKYNLNHNLNIKNSTPKRSENKITPPHTTFAFCALQDKKIYYNMPSFKGYFSYDTEPQIETYIDAYERNSTEIKEKLLYPVAHSKTDKYVPVSPFFIIYSPDKKLQNIFIKNTVNQLKYISRVVDISETNTEKLMQKLNDEMKKGREHYLKTGERSVLILNDAQKFLHSEKPMMEHLSKHLFGENRVDKLKKLDEYPITFFFKSLADKIALIPEHPDDSAYATSIILTGDDLYMIDSDLLKRAGKCSVIAPGSPDKQITETLLRRCCNKQKNYLELLKSISWKNIEDIDFPFDVIHSLKRMKLGYESYPSNIDCSRINFPILAEFACANPLNGAFETGQIEEITLNALFEYIKNPQTPYEAHLVKILANAKKNITPEKLREYENINDYLSRKLKEDSFEYRMNLKEFALYNTGIERYAKVSKKVFSVYLEDNFERIRLLEKERSSGLNQAEKEKLNVLNQLTENDKNPENTKLYKLVNKEVAKRVQKIGNDRYKFYYGNEKDDYVDLYLGSFGWSDSILWVNTSDSFKIDVTEFFADSLKKCKPFNNIQYIEFATNNPVDSKKCKNTGRVSLENKPIYRIDLKVNEKS